MPVKSKKKRITGEERRSAIANLLDTCGGAIYGFALRLCSDPDLAEDLVQESFFQGYRKWSKLRDETNPSRWLHAIVVRSYLRREGTQSGVANTLRPQRDLLTFGDDEGGPPSTGNGSINKAAFRKKALKALGKAVRELPHELRIPLLLRDVTGYSLAEVSTMLGIKESSVRTRLHRARNLIFWSVADTLPQKKTPPTRHARREWKDLLRAKHDSLDKDRAFSFAKGESCARCQGVFDAMDYVHELCRDFVSDKLPATTGQAVLLDLAGDI
ncbi:MAG: RNA polymerase sigma factor [Planctomycetes bacterium]|nr:RNA polymerase sigma factor [Planctomycetota bacterium]